MDLRSIYISNGTGIFILLVLLYVSRTKILRHRVEDKIYSFMLFGIMGACVMEALSYTLDSRVFPGSIFMNYVANTYLFTVNLLLPFCVMVYVDLGLYDDTGRIWKCYKPQIIIMLTMFAVNIVNFFVPITYNITAGNVYERGPVSYLYYLVILYYCMTCVVVTKRYEKENGDKTFFNVNMFLMPVLTGAFLQFLFYGLSLAWLAAAIGVAGLFMMQQNEMSYVDGLLEIYNRQYLSHITSAWIGRGIVFSGAMLDIDRFKRINDNYGHSEGDAALKIVADTLKQARRDNEWIFRFAGDEFIVLKKEADPRSLEAYLREVQRRLDERDPHDKPYHLTISYGFGTIRNGEIDAFMKEMDSHMYQMKEQHHVK